MRINTYDRIVHLWYTYVFFLVSMMHCPGSNIELLSALFAKRDLLWQNMRGPMIMSLILPFLK